MLGEHLTCTCWVIFELLAIVCQLQGDGTGGHVGGRHPHSTHGVLGKPRCLGFQPHAGPEGPCRPRRSRAGPEGVVEASPLPLLLGSVSYTLSSQLNDQQLREKTRSPSTCVFGGPCCTVMLTKCLGGAFVLSTDGTTHQLGPGTVLGGLQRSQVSSWLSRKRG